MVGTLAVNQLLFRIETFAAVAVKSAVLAEINVTRIVNFL